MSTENQENENWIGDKITINVSDVLSKEDVREIAIEALYREFRNQIRNEYDIERVITNLSYEYVQTMINEQWNGDFTEKLKSLIDKTLNESDLSFYLFREENLQGNYKEVSPARKIMNEEVEKLRPLIREKCEEHIQKYPFRELDEDEISYTIGKAIVDALLGWKEIEEENNAKN